MLFARKECTNSDKPEKGSAEKGSALEKGHYDEMGSALEKGHYVR
jgi:hypothetical protein